MTVYEARPKGAGDYESNETSLCFETPPKVGKENDKGYMFHPYFHGMDVSEMSTLMVSPVRPKENSHGQYSLPDVV